MMERIPADYYAPRVNKLRPEQIAHRSTWARIPDQQVQLAAMHVIHVQPAGASTVTVVNPLDPGTLADGHAGPGWLVRPGDNGAEFRHRVGR